MRPVIGIPAFPRDIPLMEPAIRGYMVLHTYTDSVIAAGGVPIVLIPVEDGLLDHVLDQIDGLLLAGGGDIAPERYGASPHETISDVDEERDRFEIGLVQRAQHRKLPTMAICRGLQVVNVAFGGTLIQDLPSVTGAIGHVVSDAGAYEPHASVEVVEGCRIARIIGAGEQRVNSLHHQAVDQVGEGIRVVATAPDGTVEGIEHEDPDWSMVAVQWHPEFLDAHTHEPSAQLFRAFIDEAAKYRAQR